MGEKGIWVSGKEFLKPDYYITVPLYIVVVSVLIIVFFYFPDDILPTSLYLLLIRIPLAVFISILLLLGIPLMILPFLYYNKFSGKYLNDLQFFELLKTRLISKLNELKVGFKLYKNEKVKYQMSSRINSHKFILLNSRIEIIVILAHHVKDLNSTGIWILVGPKNQVNKNEIKRIKKIIDEILIEMNL